MELLIDDKAINSAVLEAVDSLGLIPKEDAIGRTIDINEFRRKYCGGKSAPWVRLYIFDKFPETDFANGGWVIAPHATSGVKKSIIFEYEASRWIEVHKRELTGAQRFDLGGTVQYGHFCTNFWDSAGSSAASGPQHLKQSYQSCRKGAEAL